MRHDGEEQIPQHEPTFLRLPTANIQVYNSIQLQVMRETFYNELANQNPDTHRYYLLHYYYSGH